MKYDERLTFGVAEPHADLKALWQSTIDKVRLGQLMDWRTRISLMSNDRTAAVFCRMTVTSRDSAGLTDDLIITNHWDIGRTHKNTDAFGYRYESEGARIRLIRDLILKTMTHELDEQFTFDGKRVFDPHVAEQLKNEGRL